MVSKDGMRVFIGGIRAFDSKTGATQWTHKNDRNMCSVEWWAVGPDGDVTISTDDCFSSHPDYLYRLNGTTGVAYTKNFSYSKTEQWELADGETVYQVAGQPTVSLDGKTVFIREWPAGGGASGGLEAVDASNGALLWAFEKEVWGMAQKEDGTVFASGGKALFGLDASSHKLKWTHTVADLKNAPNYLTPPVVSWDGSATFVGQCACCYPYRTPCPVDGCFGSVEAVNSESGEVMWVMKMTDYCPSSVAIIAAAGSLVVVKKWNGPYNEKGEDQLVAIDAQSGDLLWSKEVKEGVAEGGYSLKSGTDGYAVLLNNIAQVSSIDVKNGDVQWYFEKPGTEEMIFL